MEVFKVAANDVADEVGSTRSANMVMLGAFAAKLGTVSVEALLDSLDVMLEGKGDKIMSLNREAMKRGAALAE